MKGLYICYQNPETSDCREYRILSFVLNWAYPRLLNIYLSEISRQRRHTSILDIKSKTSLLIYSDIIAGELPAHEAFRGLMIQLDRKHTMSDSQEPHPKVLRSILRPRPGVHPAQLQRWLATSPKDDPWNVFAAESNRPMRTSPIKKREPRAHL